MDKIKVGKVVVSLNLHSWNGVLGGRARAVGEEGVRERPFRSGGDVPVTGGTV